MDAGTRLEYYTETAYTDDGNFVKSETDNRGNVTSYEYDSLTGKLLQTTHPKRGEEDAVVTDYQYDSEDRITSVTRGSRTTVYEYGEFDDLTGISHNGFTYNYTHDGFGNVLTNSIAGRVICTNEYAPNNGSLVKSTFADGSYTGVTYDVYGKVTSNSMNGKVINKYVYDNDGNVSRQTDRMAEVTTKYDYNDSNMVVRSEAYSGETTDSDHLESRLQYTYTKSGKVGNLAVQEKDDKVRVYNYTYASDNKPVKSTLPDKSVTEWNYDSLRRNNKIIYTPKAGASDAKKLYTILKYQDVQLTVDGKTKKATTELVNRYTDKFGNSGKAISDFYYTYDEWGNLTNIRNLAQNERKYAYNEFSEIISAEEAYDNGTKNTYQYDYDEGGNILSETINGEKHTYIYDDVWKDQLVCYDGRAIVYDELGCPVEYMGKSMTWDVNGNLTSITDEEDKITYTYMANGRRRSKTVNGVTTTYHYNNGMLLSETTGDEVIRYYYDSTGKVAGICYKKGEGEEKNYFYTRNAQGDIIGIYRSSDSKQIGTYEYDLWGRMVSIKESEEGTDTDGILEKNPIRYRGYYYDTETEFYNLNARYYDPEIRRFISADSMNLLMVATTTVECKNLYNYAENNPVTGKDSSGAIFETVWDIITLAGSITEVCCNPTDPWAWVNLAGDIVDLTPFVTGIGEGIKGARAVAKAADKIDDTTDAAKSAAKVVRKSGSSSNVYIPMDADGNPIPLRKQNINGQDIPLPDPNASGPHTVLGGTVSSKTGEIYRQSATFPDGTWPTANGQNVPWSEVHWTDHGTPHHHTNPHQHIFEYNPDKGGWYRNEPTPYYP